MKLSGARWLRMIAVGLLLCGGESICAQTGPASVRPQDDTKNTESAPNVLGIRVVDAAGKVISEAPGNISVMVGKPLDRHQVAESIRALYRSGDYADLRAEVVAVSGGVTLDFIVRENFFVNEIIIQGLVAPPSDASAAAAMQLTLGQPYHAADVEEALTRLKESLHDEGLYDAEVTWESAPHADTHQMDIIVHVKSGERAKIGGIHLINGTEYSDAALLSRSKLKPGNQITTARLQRAKDRIRKSLGKKGHLSARASVRRGQYDTTKHLVPLELEVTEGPLVQVGVSGAKISNRDLKKLVPVYQEGAVDTDLLEEGKRNIRERLERQGYFDATVEYRTETKEVKAGAKETKGSEERIIYEIKRGTRHKLLGIAIKGNHYFDEELLKSRLQIFKGDYAVRPHFSRRLMEADRLSMLNVYHANGFLDAKVDAQATDDYKGKTGDIYIQFTIMEGRQTRVASLDIEGSKSLSKEELRDVAGSLPGQPYSEITVATDRDNILALYFNRGFPGARFNSVSKTVDAEPKGQGSDSKAEANNEEAKEKNKSYKIEEAPPIALVYRIEEGPQTLVRRVLLSGYKHTRPGVIRREVHVKPNAPLREGEVVESQRRLYNLAVFNRVTIEPQNAAGSDPDKNIVVLVEEAKRYTIAYGGGFEVQRLASSRDPTLTQLRAAPRGIFEVSKLNLTGRADSLSLRVRGSTLQGRALLAYSVPNTFGNPHFSSQATAYAEKTQDINTFNETRYEGSVQLTDQVSPFTSFLYRYTFRQVKVSNLNNTISPEQIPLFNQPTLISQFGVTWFRDSRNNPADASKGTFNSADLGIADTSIGSSASFLRFFFQNASYHPITRNFSFARSIRVGALFPYHDTFSLSFPIPTVKPFPTVIPLPERFFAGGGTSLRGFGLNQAGPRDGAGFPVGGQAMLILNQEFRFPMRLPFLGTQLGGALFYDGGNVYSRISRVTFRTSPPKPSFVIANPLLPISRTNLSTCTSNCDNELNYFSHTVGLGVRYATPVGPIRIDLGYQLNRPTFAIRCTNVPDDPKRPPVVCQQGTRLPGFQIFFNLGASF